MPDAPPTEPWYQNGLVIFIAVILVAICLGWWLDGRRANSRSSEAIALLPRDVDDQCLDTVDDDTALHFDADIEVGRQMACDRNLDKVQLPPELEAKLDAMESRDTQSNTFHGYECTDDCSGHQAGYDWAAEKGIVDADQCGGKSQSFIEGCRAYADE